MASLVRRTGPVLALILRFRYRPILGKALAGIGQDPAPPRLIR